MNGRELSRSFYERSVAPPLAGVEHSAALLGDGSEVLGLDDEVSTDHDFGPRVQVFLTRAQDADRARAALKEVPGQAEVTSAAAFFTERIGTDPAGGMGLADWLLTPTQRLATLTAGPVFHDPSGQLALRQSALSWYPDDIWRYALAAAWLRVEQEEAFVGRTGAVGDDLGSAVLAARVARDLMRLAFLVERRWAPYGKWLGTAFARLPVARRAGPALRTALRAHDWRLREAALCAAAGELALATNDLGLAEEVDPSPRQFHERDIRVTDGARFTTALLARITDPPLRALIERLGRRQSGPVARLPGTVDQAVDSTDALAHPARCRAAGPVLGL